MHLDHYHKIADTHRICQDYTISGESNEGMCAVLADGCSSAVNSDVGARLLAHQFKLKLPQSWGSDYSLAYQAVTTANELIFASGLSKEANYATIGYIFTNGHVVKAALFGDGVVYVQDKNLKETLYNVKFSDNTPYYPAYIHDNSINAAYRVGQHGRYTVQKIIGETVVDIRYDQVNSMNPTTFIGIYPTSQINVIAVFSDGISAFNAPDGDLSIPEIVSAFTSFKNYAGDFVYRRCRSEFECLRKEMISLRDDFSMIALENV